MGYAACSSDKLDVLKLLISHGADVNECSSSDKTSLLHTGVIEGFSLEVMKTLILHGADVNAVEEGYGLETYNRTREVNSRLGYVSAEYLRLSGRSPIHYAVYYCHRLPMLDLLISHGADINAMTEEKVTPLHIASREGLRMLSQRLIENGASVNAVGGTLKRTPLHQACIKGRETTVQLLLDHGANVNSKDKVNLTPLHIASRGGWIRTDQSSVIVKLLIEKGAKVNAIGGILERTPLHEACLKGKTEAVQILLDHGANVDVLDKEKKTPLQVVPHWFFGAINKVLTSQGEGPTTAKKKCQHPL